MNTDGQLHFTEIMVVATGLAMDAFAVSLGAAGSGYLGDARAVFRMAFHFGLFQFLMPVFGWFLGTKMAPLVTAVDHWVAFLLLLIVGGRMVYSGFMSPEKDFRRNPSRGWSLVMLSVATSIDALAVGLSLAMLRVDIWYPAVCIGVITGGLSVVGVQVGHRLGRAFGSRMEILGGLLLVIIGFRILAVHLM